MSSSRWSKNVPPGDASISDAVMLPHDEYNQAGAMTVILINGAFGLRKDWDQVRSHLDPYYHLLIPDMPGHGDLRGVAFSSSESSRRLQKLIEQKAHNGIANVVGFSLGAHVTMHLVSNYPSCVNEVFITGYQSFPQSALKPIMPYGFWLEGQLGKLLPDAFTNWLMDGADVAGVGDSTRRLELCRQIASTITTDPWPKPWPARTLIMAAGKGGIVPSNDHPHDAVKLMEIGRQLNPETLAVTHPLMRHPWHRQDPTLFAQLARSWFEHKPLPEGFKTL